MPRIILSLFFLVLVTICQSQQNQRRIIDSFYTLLRSSKKADTNRVKFLNNYARVIRFDSADKSILYLKEALTIAKGLKEEYWVGQSYLSMGIVYSKLSNYQNAISYSDSAKGIFNRLNKYPSLLSCLDIEAESFVRLGKYSDAIDLFHEVIKISEKIGNIEESAVAYGDIGNILSDLELNSDALINYKQALNRFKILNDTLYMAVAAENIAYCYSNLKEYPKAKLVNDTAIMLFTAINRLDGVDQVSTNQALVLGYLKQYDEALSMVKKSISAATKRKDKMNIAVSELVAAHIMLMATDSIKSKKVDQEALKYAQDGLAQAKSIGNVQQQFGAYKLLSEIYEKTSDYPKALINYKNYVLLKDSISGINKTQEIAIKQVQFENEKREAILTTANEAQIKRQKIIKNTIIYSAAGLLLAGIALFIFYKRRKDALLKQKEAELKAEISETEMKALRAQMNPHFIFNSLNSIGDYIIKNKTELADEYLTKFAKLMRLVLENSEKKEVPLTDDLKALELYMQLESLRLNNKFTYEIKTDSEINKETTLIPPLILQPFVENSIWHGIAKKEGTGHIGINIKRENGMINCIVEDNGIGRKKEDEMTSLKDSTGKRSLGMKLTKERIDIINRTKNVHASVNLTDLSPGTRVEVKLPFESIL
jgi:LPXTG-motif cell wall-anchored protein